MRLASLLACLSIVLLLSACAGSRQSGICASLPPDATASGDADAFEKEGDEHWEKRGDEAELRQAVEKWSQAVAVDPSRADLRVKLSRAHYFLADGYLRFDDTKQEEMVGHFQSGTDQAELALGQKYPKFRSKFCSNQPFKAALATLDNGAIPSMYWYATNLGKYALATSIVVVLNQKDRIKAMMEMIQTEDPAFNYYAADRYFGAFYTKIPFPDGDLPKSAEYFQKSIDQAPQYLASKVLYADLNATKAGNRELFKKLLEEVLAFDIESAPEIKPENAAEQRKAKDLLAEIDVYFPEG